MATFKKPNTQLKQINKPKSILIYADFGCTTGFGNVMKELVDRWAILANPSTTFYIFALNNYNLDQYHYFKNVVVLPASILTSDGPNDNYYFKAFLDLVRNTNFDLLYFLNDIEVVGKISLDLALINNERIENKRKPFRTVFYFPIDSVPRKENLRFLSTFDEIVTFTEYGKNIILDLAPKVVSDKVKVLCHGVDKNTFKKLHAKTVNNFKNKFFGENKIVFGTVNRNSARKDLSTIIIAFKVFLDSISNLQSLQNQFCLYIHCNNDDAFGVNLKYLALTLGLEENKNIFFPTNFSENKGIDNSELNLLYNSFDCFVTTTTAEGWGLTITEAMAAKTITITPMHTSISEITNFGRNTLALTNMEMSVFVGDGAKIRYKSTVKELVEKMHIFYGLYAATPEIITETVELAYEHIDNYNWDNTAAEFWKLIKELVK